MASVNLEIHVGSWIPKSVPYTAVRASLRSARVGSVAGPSSLLGHDDAHGAAAPPALIAVDADVVVPDAGGRLLGHLDLGDQVAAGRLRTDEVDAGRLADDTAPTVGPDQVRRPQRLAVGEVDVDAGVVLGEAGDLDALGGSARPAPRPSRRRIRSMWPCARPSV